MIRRLSTSLLTIVALVPVVNIVCQAQSLPPLTRHVRDVVLNGQAQSVGRLPATQPMRLVLVLPHRNQAALDKLFAGTLRSFQPVLPPVPHGGRVHQQGLVPARRIMTPW
jgi:hypothetical protein